MTVAKVREMVKIDSVYIEDIITGYETLRTKGRETLAKSIETASTKSRDGEIVHNMKFPARQIEVTYLLKGNNMTDVWSKFDQLAALLNVEDATFIFHDEMDKYYIGTPVLNEISDTGIYSAVGTYTINCLDPFKYSTTETAVLFDAATKTINYAGTYKAHPRFRVEFPATRSASGDNTDTSQCGYVGLVDAKEHILQFGDPEEVDWGDIDHPATNPLNFEFRSVTNWTQNGSETLGANYAQSGTAAAATDHAYPSNYGSGSGYHGPSISRILTVNEGTNFTFDWKSKFEGTKAQFGCQSVLLYNKNGNTRTLVAGVNVEKTTKDKKTKVYLYAGKKSSDKSYSVKCSAIGNCKISKKNNAITFNVGGKSNTINSDAVADLIVNEVVFYFGKNGSKTALGANYVYNCSLVQSEYSAYGDIPNTFMPGDVLEIDTASAGVTLNGVDAEWLGALGNDWENFVLEQGSNTIGFGYSDWSALTTPPILTMYYRERFI